jgi:tetratricopeptide (TPR) repeat protein
MDYTYAIQNSLPQSNYFYNRAICYSQLGEIDKAIYDLDDAINLNDKYASAYYARGSLRYEQDYKESGCEDLHIAYSLGDKRAKVDLEKYCKMYLRKYKLKK